VTMYEVGLTLTVITQEKMVSENALHKNPSALTKVVTLEQVIDYLKGHIVRAGTVNIITQSADKRGKPVEISQGIDAVDVELILQLFGVIE